MTEERKNKLDQLELKPCSRCGNPFMVKKDAKTSRPLVCENCIQLEKRKKELQINVMDSVIEAENKMTESIREMRNELTMTKGTFNKQFFLNKIKRRSQALAKSIDLLEKIEESDDENYVDEYKNLFDKMKREFN